MKSRFTVPLVGFVAVFSWWLLSTEQKKQAAIIDDDHFIDMFINNFTLTSTDKSGNTEFTLKADRLEHYNDEDTSQIINPAITFPQRGGYWLISADYGEVDDEQTFINLHDNVTMKQIGLDKAFEIKTQAMTINTKSIVIESDQTVSIYAGSLTLKSDGMYFNGKDKQLKLLSNVSGVYAPR